MILQLPSLFTKEAAEVAACPPARAPKPVAAGARLGLDVQDAKKVPDGGAWRWMEPGDEACR